MNTNPIIIDNGADLTPNLQAAFLNNRIAKPVIITDRGKPCITALLEEYGPRNDKPLLAIYDGIRHWFRADDIANIIEEDIQQSEPFKSFPHAKIKYFETVPFIDAVTVEQLLKQKKAEIAHEQAILKQRRRNRKTSSITKIAIALLLFAIVFFFVNSCSNPVYETTIINNSNDFTITGHFIDCEQNESGDWIISWPDSIPATMGYMMIRAHNAALWNDIWEYDIRTIAYWSFDEHYVRIYDPENVLEKPWEYRVKVW